VLISEPELLGTAGGVRNARQHLGAEAVVVLYCDVLIDEPLAPMLEAHRESGALATLAVYESDRLEGKGVVGVDAQGRVTDFVEHGHFELGAHGLVNAGLYVLEPAFIAAIPAAVVSDFGHDVFPAALARGEHLGTHVLPAPVLDIGTPEALAQARLHA
jgi:NDP-sugar pyrophosphorylase family protein